MSVPLRVLVCGGRAYADPHRLERVLDTLNETKGPFGLLIVGDATGADAFAKNWARQRHLQALSFKADWNKHGRAAGPIRNANMLTAGKPDLVVAFPGGPGTKDMVAQARRRGVTVLEVQ